MGIPDYWLEKEWEREFDNYAANNSLPNLELVALPHDHFGDLGQGNGALDDVNTIETQMADNDYAFGKLVEKVAHSNYKEDTLIFCIEDDAQDGPDHVDAHRTIAFVVGPYVKQGAVVSTRYSTVNMLRTIENILGLKPMVLNDGLQPPMTDVFSHSKKTWSYTAVVPDVLRTTKLPLPATSASARKLPEVARPWRTPEYWAAQTAGLDFTRSDHVNTAQFNRVLWTGMMGEARRLPAF